MEISLMKKIYFRFVQYYLVYWFISFHCIRLKDNIFIISVFIHRVKFNDKKIVWKGIQGLNYKQLNFLLRFFLIPRIDTPKMRIQYILLCLTMEKRGMKNLFVVIYNEIYCFLLFLFKKCASRYLHKIFQENLKIIKQN